MESVECGREEIVRGELRVVPPHTVRDAEIATWIATRFSLASEKRIAAFASRPGLTIEREPLTCLAPDIIAYRRENIRVDEYDVLCSPPDLIAELLCRDLSKRAALEKLSHYARFGVAEVWLVSSQAESIEIRLLHDGKYELEKVIVEGTIEPTRFPGVQIHVNEIWPK